MGIFLMYKILRLATSLFIQAFVCVPEVSANIQIICADLDILNSVKCCEVSVQARTVMAQEWQLCWECPTEASYLRAAFMLQHTFVNRFPGAAIGHFQYPFLLSPPLKTPQFRRCVFQTCMLAVQFACIADLLCSFSWLYCTSLHASLEFTHPPFQLASCAAFT